MVITRLRRRAAAAVLPLSALGDTHTWADQVEVAFPGGIDRTYVIGVCPVGQATKVEITSGCRSNPHYEAWH